MNLKSKQSGFTFTETIAAAGCVAVIGLGLMSGLGKVSERFSPISNGLDAAMTLEARASNRAPVEAPNLDFSMSDEERALDYLRNATN